MPKNILIVALLILGFSSVVFAAPYFRQEATVVPISDNAYDLGTTTQRWRNIYAVTASSTNLIVSGLNSANCDVKASINGTFSCGTDSTGASVADLVATSTNETAGRLSYWTTTSGTPAKLGEVATTTLTATSPLSLDNLVVKVGGSNSILSLSTEGTWSGNAGTATALFANGANCSAGNYPLGVNASGAVEDCTAATTGTVTSIATTYPITGGTITTTGTLGIAFGTTTANTWADTQTFSKAISVTEGTTATSTFSGNARVIGNLQVDGNFFAPVTLVNSSNLQVNGTLTVSGATTLSALSSNGFVKTSGGTGALSIDTSTYLTANQSITISGVTTGTGTTAITTAWGSATAGVLGTPATGIPTFMATSTLYGAGGIPNSALALSTISGISLGSNLSALTNDATLSGSSYNGSGAISDWGLNLGNANTWTALQTFGNASTTQIGSTGSAYFATSAGNVGIGTASPASLLQLFSTGTTTMSIDSNSATKGGCIEIKDSDGSGYTYITVSNGVLYSSDISCK